MQSPSRITILTGLLFVIVLYAFLNVDHIRARHMGIVESLKAPATLVGWNDAGLQTADGRTIPVPGIGHLPAGSVALSEVTKRGVEVAPDGSLTGLIRIYHWCGNDPIMADIRRVDLSEMLTYLRVGEPTGPVRNPDMLAHDPGGWFRSESGWSVSDYDSFLMWQDEKSYSFKSESVSIEPSTMPN